MDLLSREILLNPGVVDSNAAKTNFRARPPPVPGTLMNYASIFLLRDMSVALSSCIYQSLSDSDSINVKKLATTNV